MEKKRQSLLFLSGLAALSIGLIVYLVDRDPETVSFLPLSLRASDGGPPASGALGGCLPSFAHTYAFVLMSAAVFVPFARHPALPCAIGAAAEALLEIGQHDPVAARVAGFVPEFFEALPLLGRTKAFFLLGTFDGGDLLAIAIGGVGAYVTIRILTKDLMHGERERETLEE